MKSDSKIVQVALIAVVIAIWGLIGYKVYNAMGADIEELPNVYVPRNKADDEAITQSVKLSLDYDDPFTGQRRKRPKVKKASMMPLTSPAIIPTEPTLPSIIYNGYSYNTNGECRLAIKINGKLHFAQLGEVIEDCKFINASNDEVSFVFNGQMQSVERGK